MDGLTVDGSGVLATFGNTAGNNSIGVIRTTTSPSSAYLGAFSNTGVVFYSGSAGIKFTNNDTSQDSFKIASNGDISFYEDTGTTAKFFWDSSAERLGIGTASPVVPLHVKGTTDSNVMIVDATGTSPNYIFDVRDDGAPKFRVDGSGNVLVGTTDTTPYNNTTEDNGVAISGSGWIGTSRNNNASGLFNLTGDDGDILNLRKDGVSVGSIGVASSDLTIFSSTGNHKGLRFGNGQIVPTNNAGADSDNTTDLGGNSNRFKDLYLSGGLVLDDNPTAVGGAVTSKTLDDYEEGTWTPAIYYQNADDLTNSTNVTQSGMYTKIGNIVQATCYLKWSATDARANDNIGVSGFPFTASNSAPSSETRWIAPMVYQNTSYSTSSAQIFTTLSNNATISNFVTAHGTGNLGDDFGQNTNMIVKFTLTYHTNQ